jgi:exodeoxyribonuclease V alpha subunit
MKDILSKNRFLNEIDIHFADYICELQNSEDEILWVLTAMISYYVNQGDSAFDAKMIAGRSIADVFNIPVSTTDGANVIANQIKSQFENVFMPIFDADLLLKHDKVIGAPGETKPIIFDGVLFYLNKFFQYEIIVAEFIKARINQKNDISHLKKDINTLFPKNFIGDEPSSEINWQKVAAILALNSAFVVISGGPGTGKTTTAGNILTLLLTQNSELIVKMVAPTGKAADRLNESIRAFKGVNKDKIDPEILKKIPETAETLHKFLGVFSHRNKIDKYSPSPIDLLLIDEASMVSLPMFAKTFEALPEHCRVILLGDKDQLMAVENGNVLKDITDAEELNNFSANFADIVSSITDGDLSLAQATDNDNPMEDIAIQLEHSWRFGSQSGISNLSSAVNLADAKTSEESILKIIERFNDIQLLEISNKDAMKEYIKSLCESDLTQYKESLSSNDTGKMFALLSQFRILCAVNNGPFGVSEINNAIETFLFPDAIPDSFYPGRPIMITKNDYRLGVMNGDVGILKAFDGELKACFPADDGEFKKINPSSLDEYTTAFAISIHKSQGSEFDNVFIILPPEENKIMTKELIYTGITRAKKSCVIVSTKQIFHKAVTTRMLRQSGLKSKII